MDENIIHIGYHKTGTSWFQGNFYPNVINKTFVSRKLVKKTILSFHGLNRKSHNIKKHFDDRYGSDNFIICEEELSGNIRTGGHNGFLTKGICERLGDLFKDAQIVIFIRNQLDIIASTYKQYVKGGGNYDYKKFLFHEDYKNPYRAPLFSFDHFNYYNLIKTYEKEFGKNKVNVFLFEDFLENKKDFLRNFSEQFNLKINIQELDLEPKNKSYGKICLNIAKMLNCFTSKNVYYKYYLLNIPRWYKLSRGFVTILNNSCFADLIDKRVGACDLFDDEVIKYIRKYYNKSNKLLSKEYNLSLEDYGYPL